MGQQPNIELEISDLPRPTPRTAPARRWSAKRPGDLSSPEEVPIGGAFGTTGPDSGYALRLARTRNPALAEAEQEHNARAAIAAVAAARAARSGRAPTMEDVDLAMFVLGYETEGIPGELVAELQEARIDLVANISHSSRKKTALVARVPQEVLESSPEEVRSRMASGERLLHG